MTPRSPRLRRITPRVLARWLMVSPTTVMKWVHSGELPALKISTGDRPRFVVYRKDAAAFLRRRGISHEQIISFGLDGDVLAQK